MQINARFVSNWHYSVKQWHTLILDVTAALTMKNLLGGTLVSIWVKVAGKAKIGRVMKFAKIGLKLLLGIGLKVLTPKTEGFISKCWKKW